MNDGLWLTDKRARWLLLAACLVAFAPFVGADLFWDDLRVIRPDGPIAQLSTILKAFMGRCVLFPPGKYIYYRPVVDILLTLEYAVSGTKPFLYHLTNMALHLANALLTLSLLRRIPGATATTALAGAALFALHPLQVESVLWPAARPAMLCTVFALLALRAAMAARECDGGGGAARVVLALCAGALCLGSKEIGVALLPVAWLAVLSGELRPRGKTLVTLIGLTALGAVYLLLNRSAASNTGDMVAIGPRQFAGNFTRFMGFYLGKFAFPWNLSPFYPVGSHEAPWCFPLGVVGWLGIGALAALCIRRRSAHAVIALCGLALFAGSAMLPHLASQLVVADRYLYQAIWGVALVVGALLPQWRPFTTGRFDRYVLLVIVVVGGLSLRQSLYWLSSDLLWSRAYEIDQDNIPANLYLGMRYTERGDLRNAELHLRHAVFDKAIGLERERGLAACRLGKMMAEQGRWEDALQAFSAGERQPESARAALIGRAVALAALGRDAESLAATHSFQDDGKQGPSDYTDLALLELRIGHDTERAAVWYALARKHGAEPEPELEAALKK